MRTRLSPGNPFGYNRYGFAWEHVPAGGEAHLDFGCADGAMLAAMRAKDIRRLVGLEIAHEAVAKARRRFPGLDVRHIRRTVPLPFEDNTFTSIILLDVLEHVHEQQELLDEVRRVLRDDGRLIVTVPRQYVFSFLDIGNFKFRFPRMHRWLYRLAHSRAEYERRYVANPDGLIGDVSARKKWHEHFSKDRLAAVLARSGLEPVAFDGSAFLTRPLAPLLWLMRQAPGLRQVAAWIGRLDARWFASMNLFCVAVKARPSSAEPASRGGASNGAAAPTKNRS